MADFRLSDHVRELNLAAAALARRAVDEMNLRTPEKPRFVAGSIGPTNKQLSIAGNVNDPGYRGATFDQMVATYYEQVEALVEGGVDLLLCETAFDTLVMKACLFAIDQYFERSGMRVPVMASFTVFEGRPHAVGPDGRGLLELDLARRPAQRGHQLRAGAGEAAALHRRAVADRAGLRELLSERRACPTPLAASTKRPR